MFLEKALVARKVVVNGKRSIKIGKNRSGSFRKSVKAA